MASLPLALALCGCEGGYDGPDADWCDPSVDPPPIVSNAYVGVFDVDGSPYCPPTDSIVRAVQGADRNYELDRVPRTRAERGDDGRIVLYDDPAGCNAYSSGDAFEFCRPATLMAVVEIPACGTFDASIEWLENYGSGANGISWALGVDVDCADP